MANMNYQPSRTRGIVSVELAILTPVLLLLVFGVIEYSWFFVKSGEVTNAARHAARMAVTPDATNAEITTDVTAMMTQSGMVDSGYELSVSADDVTLVGFGDSITVILSVPYANVSLNLPFVPTPTTMGATVTMAKESP